MSKKVDLLDQYFGTSYAKERTYAKVLVGGEQINTTPPGTIVKVISTGKLGTVIELASGKRSIYPSRYLEILSGDLETLKLLYWKA